MLELGAPVLGLAFAGGVYLMLALGLFGVSRFALFVAIVVPAIRVFYAWNPLPALEWEQLRSIGDLIIAIIALFLLWHARHRPTH